MCKASYIIRTHFSVGSQLRLNLDWWTNLLPTPLTDFLLYYQKFIFWETALWKDRGVDWSFRVRRVFSQEPEELSNFQQPQPLKMRALCSEKVNHGFSSDRKLLPDQYLSVLTHMAENHKLHMGKSTGFWCTKIWAPILVRQLTGNMTFPFPSLSYLICKMEDTHRIVAKSTWVSACKVFSP